MVEFGAQLKLNSVAGQGYRLLVKQDYEPCKILTFHPHDGEQSYYSTCVGRMVKYRNMSFNGVLGRVAQMVRAEDS